jgi:hypothetical protein
MHHDAASCLIILASHHSHQLISHRHDVVGRKNRQVVEDRAKIEDRSNKIQNHTNTNTILMCYEMWAVVGCSVLVLV